MRPVSEKTRSGVAELAGIDKIDIAARDNLEVRKEYLFNFFKKKLSLFVLTLDK